MHLGSDKEMEKCGECDMPILPDQASCIYDGERCHLPCAAEAEDEAFFDRDMGFGDS